MFYKLNKNMLFAVVLVLLGVSNAKAQGVVTLVEETDAPSLENKEPAATPATTEEEKPQAEVEVLETTDEIIPLDESALITPPTPEEALPDTQVEETSKAEEAPKAEEKPAKDSKPEDFSLELKNQPEQASPETKPALPETTTATAPLATVEEIVPKSEPQFGDSLLSLINNDLFSQMSDIEKQTTLLTLELRREKLKNELAAIKEQREKAYQEKLAAEEEKQRKQQEWETEQKAKILREQQALKEKEIQLEKLKQRKVLTAYMNQMLKENQTWIQENAKLYKKIQDVEEDRKRISDVYKEKLENLSNRTDKLVNVASEAKGNHDRAIANLTAQNVQLRKRLEATELELKNKTENPFSGKPSETTTADGKTVTDEGDEIDAEIAPIAIAKEYAILDITGKGDEMNATLMNKDGQSFMVREGTLLQTGHAVEKIGKNYIQFDRNGLKDFLYTSTSATNVEPEPFVESEETLSGTINKAKKIIAPKKKGNTNAGLTATKGMPSLGAGMFVK